MDPMGYTSFQACILVDTLKLYIFPGVYVWILNTTQAEKIQTAYLNPPPSVHPNVKNHPQNNTPSKTLTWTNFWRWHFYKKQPFQKPKSHRASKVTTSSPKKLQLATFPSSPFSNWIPGGEQHFYLVATTNKHIPSHGGVNSSVWQPGRLVTVGTVVEKNLILPGPWKLPKTVGCDAETGEEMFRRDVGRFWVNRGGEHGLGEWTEIRFEPFRFATTGNPGRENNQPTGLGW